MRKTIEIAYAAIDDLKELGISLAEPIIVDLTVSGRLGRYVTLEYKLESVEKISHTLRKIGVTDKEIEEMCGVLYDRVEADHYRRILYSIRPEDWEKNEAYKDFNNWKFSEWNMEKVEKFAKENSLDINEEAKEWTEDLEYFMKNRKLRRSNKWQG